MDAATVPQAPASRWGTRLWVFTVVLVAAALASPLLLPGPVGLDRYPLWREVTLIALGDATLGAIILRHRPKHLIGWLFLVGGLLSALQLAAGEYAGAEPAAVGGTAHAALVAVLTQFLVVGGKALVFQLYPTGSVLSRRWRVLAWATVGGIGLIATAMAIAPGAFESLPRHQNPLGVAGAGEFAEAASQVGSVVWAIGVLGGIVSLGLRLRRADGIERRQLVWFVYAAAVGVTTLVVMTVFLDPVMESTAVGGVVWGGAGLGLSAAATMAIVRYRLYEIDRIVSRTVTYGLVTAVLVGVYALMAVVPAALFDLQSDLVVAGATLVAAAAFGPVRRRVQAGVDRRFNRSRYDAALVVERFGGRLRDQVDLAEVAADLRGAVAASVQPTQVSLWPRETGPTR